MVLIKPRDIWNDDYNSTIINFFKKSLSKKNNTTYQKLINSCDHTGSTFYIDNSYNVKGVGLVISGINRGDTITSNDTMYIGPINKKFIPVKLKSFHNDNREIIQYLDHHHRGCIMIKPIDSSIVIKKKDVKHGVVMISDIHKTNNIGYRFNAAISIFGTHSASLKNGYAPLIHAKNIRQNAKMYLDLDASYNYVKTLEEKKIIKAGDIKEVIFRFSYHTEYIEPGTVFVFRSGSIHGIGIITDMINLDNDIDPNPEPRKKHELRKRINTMKHLIGKKKNNINKK
jgi:GTPase